MKADNKQSGVKVKGKYKQSRRETDKTKDWYISSSGIRIKRTTKDRLKRFGKFGQDYDTLINELLDTVESKSPKT